MKQDILILSTRAQHTKSAYVLLSEHNISTTVVTSREEALHVLHSHTPAFFWIDVDTDTARSLLTEIMDKFLHPPSYIILTASFADSADRADMLDHGADACVEVPVDLREILAILNAVLRREERLRYVSTSTASAQIKHKQLVIEPQHRKVTMRNKIVKLTPKEYDILYLLAANPGAIFSKEKIYSRIWKEAPLLGLDVVFNHLSSLRKKLGLGPGDNEYIQTVHKVGYRFAAYEPDK